MKSRVALVKCSDYSPESVETAVRTAIDLVGGIGSYIQSGDSVFVKPNLLSPRHPGQAVTTHPAVMAAVIRELIDAGANVRVGDSPPFKGENPESYRRLCDITGTTEVCERLGVSIARLEESAAEIGVDAAKLYKRVIVSREILDSACWISIPKLKTHQLTTLSGAVKNIFGCVPGKRKAIFHAQACTEVEHFCEMLVDLLLAVPPRLTIMDAVIGMEGNGPAGGTPRMVGAIIAGTDPVAIDAVCARLIGLDPMSIITTRLAHERGLGCGDIAGIELVGTSLDELLVPDFKLPQGKDQWLSLPPVIRRIARKQLTASPHISPTKCKNCLDCLKACPVGVISKEEKHPTIDLESCIRCYCCHEVCMYNAIDLKQGVIGKLLAGR